jgi:hypothetical protein
MKEAVMSKKVCAALMLSILITSAFAVSLKKQEPAAAAQDSATAAPVVHQGLVPIAGHTIKIDKSLSDWKGDLPTQDDTWVVDQGEFIWRDAQGDDKGSGSYTYPTNAAFANAADLREVRITWDSKNLYLLIKCRRPGDWWAPYRMVGIHKENSNEPSTTLLAQGNPEDRNPEEGGMGNIKVAPELACQYVLGLSSTWKVYLWNAKNKLIGHKTGKDDDTPGLRMDDANWNGVEVAIPLELIGSPAGQTWKFIVATGLQESDYFRGVEAEQTEWHGGGGDGDDKEPGACPSAYDLAGAPKALQDKDLSSYRRGGSNSDSGGFAVIKNSYLTVKFAAKPTE